MAAKTRQQKLHPKLRMIANGDDVVNAGRSHGAAYLASTLPARGILQADAFAGAAAAAVGQVDRFETRGPRPYTGKNPGKLTSKREARHAFASVFIEVHRDRQVGGARVTAQDVDTLRDKVRKSTKAAGGTQLPACFLSKRNFVAATVPVTELTKLIEDERIAFIQPAEPLALTVPRPERGSAKLKPPARKVKGSDGGRKVIIGIIDVGGFDFAHPDFLDERGRTRFRCIWDQREMHRPPPSKRRGKEDFRHFNFGSEILKADMNSAIAAAARGRLTPALIEPQSQSTRSSHGTHVASIAAGRSGVCPKAEIAAVLIDIPRAETQEEERRKTFTDSTRLVAAVEYLLEVAREAGKPISINISLGTNGGSHDGSGGVSRWLDALLSTEGRSICVAAGNAGQEGPTKEDPLGWMFGRIHASGKVASRGLMVDLEWVVTGDTIADVSENELEIWYSPQDRFRVAVKPPGASRWIEVAPQQYVENKLLPSGTFLSVYNELFHPVNGANYCAIYLSPDLRPKSFTGVQAGTWTVRLIGEEVRNGAFHCWVERDNLFEIEPVDGRRVGSMPSFFSKDSNVDSHAINSLSCGHRVIAVANLDERRLRVAETSSQGPTRDDRPKPDIAAPGTGIVAANGFSEPAKPWVGMSGTSMASPYVAGVVGLMLSANEKLTAAQCVGILQRTARALPGASYEWKNDAGFGAVDADAALAEARTSDLRRDITHKVKT